MTTETDVNAFLNSTGVQGAKFEAIGTVVRGTIIDAQVWDQTDMATGAKKKWDDGNPRKQLVITIQTDEQVDEDDSGLRRLYAKKPGELLSAIQEAVGSSGLATGGKLAVKYTGDGEPMQRGWNPPKLYAARYEPPAIAIDEFADSPAVESQPWGGAQEQRVMTREDLIEEPPPHEDDDLPF